MGAASVCGQDASGELRAGQPVDCGDQQPFSRGRRALPGQVQHIHITVAVGIVWQTGRSAHGTRGAGEVIRHLRRRSGRAAFRACRGSSHGQAPPGLMAGGASPAGTGAKLPPASSAAGKPELFPRQAGVMHRADQRPPLRGTSSRGRPAPVPGGRAGSQDVRARRRCPGRTAATPIPPLPGAVAGRTRARRAARGAHGRPASPEHAASPADLLPGITARGLDHPATAERASSTRTDSRRNGHAPPRLHGGPAAKGRRQPWQATPMSC